MNLVDVYFKRVTSDGDSVGQIAHQGEVRSFNRWLKESLHTIPTLTVDRREGKFAGIILTKKDKEYKKILSLHVSNEEDVLVGDLLNWNSEKWLIFSKEQKVNGAYQTFEIVKCNQLLKWIDQEGILKESWCYFTSSLESKIKENFRTWNSLITPQPNKYAEVILPRMNIPQATTFIVEGEAWYVVEKDISSVEGITYLSLTEEKVNIYYDDLKEEIANTDKRAIFEIKVPTEQVFYKYSTFTPTFYVTKNGNPVEEEVLLTSSDPDLIIKDNQITCEVEKKALVTATLKRDSSVNITFEISVASSRSFVGYLSGPSEIKMGKVEKYVFVGNKQVLNPVSFRLETTKLARIVESDGKSCLIAANTNNQLGKIVLIAIFEEQEYKKEIEIKTIW